MREILFRGKQEEYPGEWIEGMFTIGKFAGKEYHAIERRERHIITYDYEWTMQPYKVIPDTIGQYTGLTDKNGNKIFEGDICRHYGNYAGKNIYAPVVFELGMFYLKYDKKAGMPLGDMCERVEVVGNIYDNPDLLKGGVSV